MIYAKFYRCGDSFSGFEVSGHAGYADEGADVVCAAVSSAVQLTANSLTDFAHIVASVKAENDTVSVKIKNGCHTEVSDMLIASLRNHLKILAEDYAGTIEIAD